MLWLILSVATPAILEWVGVLPASYTFAGGVMSIVPHMHALPEIPTLAAMLTITVVSMLGTAMFVGETRDALAAAETRLDLHAWQLRQLIPQDEPESLRPGPRGPSGASARWRRSQPGV